MEFRSDKSLIFFGTSLSRLSWNKRPLNRCLSVLNLVCYVYVSSTDLTVVITQKLKSANIYVLGSLVKMFFRSLPDPLFTEALYTRFAEGIGM